MTTKNVTPIFEGGKGNQSPYPNTVFRCVFPTTRHPMNEIFFEQKCSMDPNVGMYTVEEAWSAVWVPPPSAVGIGIDVPDIRLPTAEELATRWIVTRHMGMSWFGMPNIISSVPLPVWWQKRPRIVL